jgi:hypothetical protein
MIRILGVIQMTVQSFNSDEEMWNAIRKGILTAKERATPEQNAITYGDYWMRVWEDFLIFGTISHPDDLDAAERLLGASEEEIKAERKMLAESYENGFRFGKAYSVIVPEGELGDTHVSEMTKITKEEFEEAKALGWGDDVLDLPWFAKYFSK